MLVRPIFIAYMAIIFTSATLSWQCNYYLFILWCVTSPSLAIYFITKDYQQLKKYGKAKTLTVVGSEMQTLFHFSSIFFCSMMCIILSFFLA